MINGEIKLLYWAPGKGNKSFGHLALEITDAEGKMTYISYIPPDDNHLNNGDNESKGYKMNNCYEDDKLLMGNKFHTDYVSLTGLVDVGKIIEAHEEFIKHKKSPEFDYRLNYNCSSVVLELLLEKGGLKTSYIISRENLIKDGAIFNNIILTMAIGLISKYILKQGGFAGLDDSFYLIYSSSQSYRFSHLLKGAYKVYNLIKSQLPIDIIEKTFRQLKYSDSFTPWIDYAMLVSLFVYIDKSNSTEENDSLYTVLGNMLFEIFFSKGNEEKYNDYMSSQMMKNTTRVVFASLYALFILGYNRLYTRFNKRIITTPTDTLSLIKYLKKEKYNYASFLAESAFQLIYSFLYGLSSTKVGENLLLFRNQKSIIEKLIFGTTQGLAMFFGLKDYRIFLIPLCSKIIIDNIIKNISDKKIENIPAFQLSLEGFNTYINLAILNKLFCFLYDNSEQIIEKGLSMSLPHWTPMSIQKVAHNVHSFFSSHKKEVATITKCATIGLSAGACIYSYVRPILDPKFLDDRIRP